MTPCRGLAVLATILLVGCGKERGPAPGSEAYEEAVGEFHVGVAALQVGEETRASGPPRARAGVVASATRGEWCGGWGSGVLHRLETA